MWFDIIKDSSIEQHIEELIPKINSYLIAQGIEPTAEQIEKTLMVFIREIVLQGKKYPHEFLEV